MQATGKSLTALIDGKLQYLIPVFQRDYSWTAEQCEQLWQDVLAVAEVPPPHGIFLAPSYTPLRTTPVQPFRDGCSSTATAIHHCGPTGSCPPRSCNAVQIS